MAHGAKLKLITKNISMNRSVASLKLWGVALSRIRKNSFGLVTSVVTREDIEAVDATDEDLSGVVNMINTIPGSKAAILLSETQDGRVKASLRTESEDIDVSRLAAIFGGGGHKKASGFTVPGQLEISDDGSWRVSDNE
jgi:phosphoesterase RecJ-like protein